LNSSTTSSDPTRTNSNRTPTNNHGTNKPTKNWARGDKGGQGARGNYKGKDENYDPDYYNRFQANHVNGATAAASHHVSSIHLPGKRSTSPFSSSSALQSNQLVSSPFALNTEIMQPQEKAIFSHDGRFYTSTDVFNENGRFAKFSETINENKINCMSIFPNNEIFIKLEENRDTIDRSMFFPSTRSATSMTSTATKQ